MGCQKMEYGSKAGNQKALITPLRHN